MIDRLLSWTAGPDPATERAQLVAFRRFLLLYGAVRSWLWLHFLEGPAVLVEPLPIAISAIALSLCAALAWPARTGWLAPRLALPALGLQLAVTFPHTDNHFILELLCMGLLALPGRRGEDSELALRALCWLAAIVLFQTGLQKLLYGHYLHGDFLTFMAATNERFAALLGWLIDPATLASLRAMDPFQTGAGPYRSDALWVVLGSNAVVVAELVLPLGMLARPTRTPAMLAAIGLVLAIQTGARELGFALLFTNLLLLFAPSDWSRRLLPLWVALLILALLSVGVLGVDWLGRGML